MPSGRGGRSRPGSADFRATENGIWLTRAEWREQLLRVGFTPKATVPCGERDPVAVLGQYLYVATPAGAGMTRAYSVSPEITK